MFPLFLILIGIHFSSGQFTAQTYPDPRTEPLRCKLLLPGQVCDPSDILLEEERRRLNEKIQHFMGMTGQIRNSALGCQNNPAQQLQIVVALMEKIGSSPVEAVDIEKFTNDLRMKYLNFQVRLLLTIFLNFYFRS